MSTIFVNDVGHILADCDYAKWTGVTERSSQIDIERDMMIAGIDGVLYGHSLVSSSLNTYYLL